MALTITYEDPINRAITTPGNLTSPPNYPAWSDVYSPSAAPASQGPNPGTTGWKIDNANQIFGTSTGADSDPAHWLLAAQSVSPVNAVVVSWFRTTTIGYTLLRAVPSPDGIVAPFGIFIYHDFASGTNNSHIQVDHFNTNNVNRLHLIGFTGYTAGVSLPTELLSIAMLYNATPGVGPMLFRLIIRDGAAPNGANLYDSGTITDNSGRPAALVTSCRHGLYGANNNLCRRYRIYSGNTGVANGDIPANLPSSLFAPTPTMTVTKTSVAFTAVPIKGVGSITHATAKSTTGYNSGFSSIGSSASVSDTGLTGGSTIVYKDDISDTGSTITLKMTARTQLADPILFGMIGDSEVALTAKSAAFPGGNDPAAPVNPKFQQFWKSLQNGGRVATVGAAGVSGSQAEDWALAKAPTVSTNNLTAGAVNPTINVASGSIAGATTSMFVLLGDEIFPMSAVTATTAVVSGTLARNHNSGTTVAIAKDYLYHAIKDGVVSGLAMTNATSGLTTFFTGSATPWLVGISFDQNEFQLQPNGDPNAGPKAALQSICAVLAGMGFTPVIHYSLCFSSYNASPPPTADGSSGQGWPTIDSAVEYQTRYNAMEDTIVGTVFAGGLNGSITVLAGSKAVFKGTMTNNGRLYEGLHYNYRGDGLAQAMMAQAINI